MLMVSERAGATGQTRSAFDPSTTTVDTASAMVSVIHSVITSDITPVIVSVITSVIVSVIRL